MNGATECPRCGHQSTGKFCSRCGAPRGAESACRECGSPLEGGALFCSECGAPAGRRPAKPLAAYLPWILSGVALVAFSVAITLFVRGQASERAPGMPPTGGLPGADAAAGGMPGGAAAGMPTAAELAAMSPREAADRLFDRAMSTREAGDEERAAFFARMGLQAYDRLPLSERDADSRFHVGLLHLSLGDTGAAAREADAILAAAPSHLLGLILRARVAEAAGDRDAAEVARRGFREALPAERAAGRPEYEAHAGMIEAEAAAP